MGRLSGGVPYKTETHLIPLILKMALGQREAISIFGTDYNTPDVTCIRAYIHVLDLAEAHIRALEALDQGVACGAYNVGTGTGYSVREVIAMTRRVTGKTFRFLRLRREGDPDSLVAKVEKIQKTRGWQARTAIWRPL